MKKTPTEMFNLTKNYNRISSYIMLWTILTHNKIEKFKLITRPAWSGFITAEEERAKLYANCYYSLPSCSFNPDLHAD
jgi:hypothetical protein